MTARHRRQVCSRPGRLSQDRELLLDTEPAPPFHAPEQLSSRVGHRSCAIPSSSSKPASTSLPRRPQDGPHRRDTIGPVTGLESATGTFNALIGSPGPATEKIFVNGSQLLTQTLSGAATAFGPITMGVSSVTSDEEQFLITFNAPGQ